MSLLLRMQLFSVFCHHWLISGSPKCTVCRQCMTCIWCGSCLSQFQICVCVSGLVHWLPVSKFSLCQSLSTVTKSLSSLASASCQSVKKNMSSCVLILNSLENPSLAVDLHWDTTAISILQLFKGSVMQVFKQCKFSSESMRSAAVTQAFVPVDNE